MAGLMRRGVVGATLALLAGCGTVPYEGPRQWAPATTPVVVKPPTTIGGITYLDQNWSLSDRQWYYYTTQGSRLLPYDWFMALNDAHTGRPVSQSLTQLGYLPASPGKDNPDGLAVGFVKDAPKGAEPAIGLTCAACHTNDIKAGGATIRVEGAGVTGDLWGLLVMIDDGLKRVLADEASFASFAAKVLGPNATPADKLALLEKVAVFLNGKPGKPGYSQFVVDSASKTKWGNARTDAFGMIFNRVSAIDLDYPPNNRSPAAPVSYPHLWSAPQQPVNQWDGVVPNANAFEALGRNAGEVLGVFGEAVLKKPNALYYAYHSSINVGNLLGMEDQLRHLAPPSWPEETLGAVDTVKAKRGAELYQQACVSCHALRPRTNNSNAPTPIVMTSLFKYKVDSATAIGTICSKGVDAAIKAGMVSVTYASDPKMAVDAACRTVETRQLSGVKMPPIIGPALKPTDSAVALLTNAVLGTVLGKIIYEDPALLIQVLEQTLQEKVPEAEKAAITDPKTFTGQREDGDARRARTRLAKLAFKIVIDKKKAAAKGAADPLAYKARPLDGVWATGPFMHNGSVPSLYELLLPAEKRSKKFPVGSGAFDAKTVGLPVIGPMTGYWFDTTELGNANTGHEWGADWSDADRWAMVEYLKTL